MIFLFNNFLRYPKIKGFYDILTAILDVLKKEVNFMDLSEIVLKFWIMICFSSFINHFLKISGESQFRIEYNKTIIEIRGTSNFL